MISPASGWVLSLPPQGKICIYQKITRTSLVIPSHGLWRVCYRSSLQYIPSGLGSVSSESILELLWHTKKPSDRNCRVLGQFLAIGRQKSMVNISLLFPFEEMIPRHLSYGLSGYSIVLSNASAIAMVNWITSWVIFPSSIYFSACPLFLPPWIQMTNMLSKHKYLKLCFQGNPGCWGHSLLMLWEVV